MKKSILLAAVLFAALFVGSFGAKSASAMPHVLWWQMGVSWSHAQGDMGEDIGTPVGTPITALCSGPIVGAGFYGGGGVVTTRCNGVGDVYYQHMDSLASWIGECAPYGNNGLSNCHGQWANYGSLLGYSGGDCGWHFFGNPCYQWSNGPHTEVGINPPWYGIWGPQPHPGGNYDPYWFVAKGGTGAGSSTGGGVTGGGTTNGTNGSGGGPVLYTVKATGNCPCNSLELIAHWYGFNDSHNAAWQKLYNFSNNASRISRDAKAHGVKAHFEAYLYTGEVIWT